MKLKSNPRLKLLEKIEKKEEKEQTEEERRKSLIKVACGQTDYKEKFKKSLEKREEISGGIIKNPEKKESKSFTEYEEQALFDFIVYIVEHSEGITLKEIREEVYKFGKVKDIREIFKKINGKDSRDWLYSFLKTKLK